MNHFEDKASSGIRGLGLFLAISIVLHLGFLLSKLNPFAGGEKAFTDKRPIEITEISPEQLKKMLQTEPAQQRQKTPPVGRVKEIAESEDARNREIDPNARFLSDKNQTAPEQTKAKDIDDFRKKEEDGKNRGAEALKQPPPPTGDAAKGKTAETFDNDPLSPTEVAENKALVPDSKNLGVKRDWKTLNLKDLGVGGNGVSAATDDRLQGVDAGDSTILSTREYKFFSYYHRIKELLRQHWKPNVERRLTRLYEKGRNITDDELITRLQVLLSPEGRITKISRVASSGIEEIDEAAVEAFNRASPFPNPPKGMLDADGFVRINWDFILKTEAAPRIQFSNAGRPIP